MTYDTDLIWHRTSAYGNWIYVGLSQGDGSSTIMPLQDAD